MEATIEVVLELLLELLLFVLEIMFSSGWESWSAARKLNKRPHAAFAAAGYLAIGCALGAASTLVFSTRLSHNDAISLLSVILNPFLFGTAMHFFGEYRHQHNKSTTRLATWWGGGLFALGAALTRYALIVGW